MKKMKLRVSTVLWIFCLILLFQGDYQKPIYNTILKIELEIDLTHSFKVLNSKRRKKRK
jgi:hypothetical protein